MSIKNHLITNLLFKLGLITGTLFFLTSGLLIIWFLTLNIPDFTSLQNRVVAQSTKIFDRTGQVLLYDAHKDVKRTLVKLPEISDDIKKATIAIEDEQFYQHSGVRPTAILRAVIVNLSTGRLEQGGSTLTQQVVKNTILVRDKQLSRKLKEWILALKVEQTLSKDEILELYLNETPYGGNIYGIEEASRVYFNKSAKDISLIESAYLAALPQAPSYLSPFGSHRDKLENRKNTVLKKMLDLKYINQNEYNSAIKEVVTFAEPDEQNIKAPHFVFFVLDYLEKKYGEEMVRNGGLRVITTLDWSTQQQTENLVKDYGPSNLKQFNAHNAGVVAIDPKTGQIITMIGSIDYFDINNQGNFNITTAKRQPGSAFKPFVYATAFELGYTPETVLFDLPTEFNVNCTPEGIPKKSGVNCYSPVNYDNIFVGPISLKNALAQSRNIPAVKVLYLAGIDKVISLAKNFGITTLTTPSRYGLTLVLGGGEVTLLEMTNAYGVFASEGLYRPHTAILKVTDSDGVTLEEFTNKSTKIIKTNTARQISDILSDNNARIPAFGANSQLYIPGHNAAVKTGTTNDYKDAWIIGYTPNIVIGAWAGNNDNSPMEKKVAGMIIAPLWNKIINSYLKDEAIESFNKPELLTQDLKPVLRGIWQGGNSYLINTRNGKLANENTPPELVKEEVITQVHSILYWVDKANPQGPKPSAPYNNDQFILWETPIRNWVIRNGIIENNNFQTPTEIDRATKTTSTLNNLSLEKLIEVYQLDSLVNIKIENYQNNNIKQVDLFINNIYLGSNKNSPFNFIIHPNELEKIRTVNEIKVIVYDQNNNKKELYTELLVNLGNTI